MTPLLKLNPLARGLTTLYTSALLAGMWSMIVPAVPVIAKSFAISPGAAAQIMRRDRRHVHSRRPTLHGLVHLCWLRASSVTALRPVHLT